ncbi:MAG TPA: hypothetical protein VK631_20420 [Solirubrobacteraceae bacterium]|nr:hypothetical protein [Solirubrobacteraceae bacterium]
MSLAALINRACVITRRSDSGAINDYGDPVMVETTETTVCELQKQVRRASEEPDTHGELSDTLWVAFFPPGTTFATADTLTVDGQVYEAVGDPWNVRNPRTASESHIEATVRRAA